MKTIVSFRLVYEDPFEGIFGIIIDGVQKHTAIREGKKRKWIYRLDNNHCYPIRMEAVYNDGTIQEI